jgi:hypothetical protein
VRLLLTAKELNEFFGVLEQYNEAITPVPTWAYFLGIAAILLVWRGGRHTNRFVSAILGLFWIWTGLAYHMLCFANVDSLGLVYGFLFVMQGMFFLFGGTIDGDLSFGPTSRKSAMMGSCFVVFTMIAYPIAGSALGYPYYCMSMFGVTPSSTAIYTIGLLLLTSQSVPLYFLAIPVLWSLVGFWVAIRFGVVQDYGLLIIGVTGVFLIIKHNRRLQSPARTQSLRRGIPSQGLNRP